MTKKILFFMIGSFALICSASFAQPVLTATGINPVIGESYTLYSSAYVNPGSSGTNQTWNLSSMSGTTLGLTSLVAPASAPSGASFTSANIAAYDATSSSAIFYNTTSTALQNYGSSGSKVIIYSDPEDMLHFPFNYTNTYIDHFAGSYTSGYTYTRKGTITVTADGYGTLTTPSGTYNNVMRVHAIEAYTDSTFSGTAYVVNITNDQYIWYRPTAHVPLASVYTLTSSQSGTTTGGSYTVGSLGIDDIPEPVSFSYLYPNPATNNIIVDLTLTEGQKVNIQFFNALGQQVEKSQSFDGVLGSNSIKIDVSGLQAGVYFAQVMLNGAVAVNKRFVVAK